MTLKIKNWEKFQHYKDRNPPWVKLYYETLFSEDWILLDESSRLLMLVLLMVASRKDGDIPNDLNYIQKIGQFKKKPDLKPLIDCGFIVFDSNTLANCKQNAPVSVSVSVYDSVSKSLSLGVKEGVGTIGGKTKTFTKPEPAEVTEYAKSIGFDLDGQKFCDYYESKGWVIGKSPMKDWKACVRTWKSNGHGGQHGQQRTNAHRNDTSAKSPDKPSKFGHLGKEISL